jgi:hypothetical protein
MPGGSPFFPDEPSIDRLYRRLEKLFAEAARNFRGMTLEEFTDSFPRSAWERAVREAPPR